MASMTTASRSNGGQHDFLHQRGPVIEFRDSITNVDEPGSEPSRAYSKIACPSCGVPTVPREDGLLCLACTRSEHDWRGPLADHVTRHPKILAVQRCPVCDKMRTSPFAAKVPTWEPMQRESDYLLGFLLRRVRSSLLSKRALSCVEGISRALDGAGLTVTDARHIWTEPHSRRLKIEVEIAHGTLSKTSSIRQRCVLEFTEERMHCESCLGEKRSHQGRKMGGDKSKFTARIQVRVKRHDKGRGGVRTLRSLEESLRGMFSFSKNLGARRTPHEAGFDVDFDADNDAVRFLTDLKHLGRAPLRVVDCRGRSSGSKKLMTHDCNSNTSEWARTTLVELPPIDKFDIVLLDASTSTSLEAVTEKKKKQRRPRAALVLSVRSSIRLLLLNGESNNSIEDEEEDVDDDGASTLSSRLSSMMIPSTKRGGDRKIVEINGEAYFKRPFDALVSAPSLQDFLILKDNEEEEEPVVTLMGKLRTIARVVRVAHVTEDPWLVEVGHLPPAAVKPGLKLRGYDLRSVAHRFDLDFDPLPRVVVVAPAKPTDGSVPINDSSSVASTMLSKAAKRRQKKANSASVVSDSTVRDFEDEDFEALVNQPSMANDELPRLDEEEELSDAQWDEETSRWK